MKKRLLLMLFMLLMFVIFALTLPTRPPTVYPTGTAAATTIAGACRLNDLGAAAGWQTSGGAGNGRLVLTNYGDTSCTLQGRPRLRILTADGTALNTDTVIPLDDDAPRQIAMPPNASAHASFEWHNWCGDAPSADLQLEVTLDGHPGKLTVPATDPNGNPLRSTALCDAPDEPSSLAVDALLPGAE